MKGMIFTTDAIFSLVIVGAALSIIVYFNVSIQTPYSLAATQVQNLLGVLGTTTTSSLNNASLVPCYTPSNTSVLQAATQMYLGGSGSCATYLLDSISPMTNYSIFINGIHPLAAQFNGVSSKVAVPDSSSIDSLGVVTVSAWVNFPASATKEIVEKSSSGAGPGPFELYQNGQKISFDVNNNAASLTSTNSLTLNTWYNVIGEWDGSTLRIFINGVQDNSVAYSGTLSPSTGALGIGAYPGTGASPFLGSIADVQIYSAALSAGQAVQLYQEGITGSPLAGAGNVGLWPLNGDTGDYSGSNNAGTATNLGYAASNYISPNFPSGYSNYGAYAPALNLAQFSGASDVYVPNSNSLNLTNNFAISLWFKPSQVSQTNTYLLSKLTSGGGDNAYSVIWQYTTNCVEFYSGSYSGTNPRTGSCMTVADTNWHNIVYTYNGNIWQGYLDNKQVFSTTETFSLTKNYGPLYLAAFNGASHYFAGAITDVQIYNASLSSGQISSLYQEGIAGPPSSAARNVGWWLLEGDAGDYSGYNNAGTPVGVAYAPGNYLPPGFINRFSLSRAAIIAPFSRYQSSFHNASIFTYNAEQLYTIGVYAWR